MKMGVHVLSQIGEYHGKRSLLNVPTQVDNEQLPILSRIIWSWASIDKNYTCLGLRLQLDSDLPAFSDLSHFEPEFAELRWAKPVHPFHCITVPSLNCWLGWENEGTNCNGFTVTRDSSLEIHWTEFYLLCIEWRVSDYVISWRTYMRVTVTYGDGHVF